MNKYFSGRLPFLMILLIPLFIAACSITSRMPFQNVLPGSQFGDNGERIYFTATNSRGERISYTGGPAFGDMMMGSYLTCAACHGPEARGGTHVMHMQVMDAPDIRYTALSAEAGEHGESEGEEHGEYDLEDFRLAAVEGKHPDGEMLSRDMPRWQMSDGDLADLFAFLKTIP